MNKEKEIINQKLYNKDTYDLDKLIKEYELKYPFDLELYTMKTNYCLHIGDIRQSLKYATEGLRLNPCNADMHYNIATVQEKLCDFKLAYENYSISLDLFKHAKQESMVEQSNKSLDRIIEKIDNNLSKTSDINTLKELNEIVKYLETYIEKRSHLFTINHALINSYYHDTYGFEYYIAHYTNWLQKIINSNTNTHSKDLTNNKGEFVKLHATTNTFEYNVESDILLPIFCDKLKDLELNVFKISTEIKTHYLSMLPEHFNYLRLPGKVKLEAKYNAVIGKPILLKQDPSKKKLILNIFIDGLPQIFINSPNFNEYMPNTQSFFTKGIIFNNVYADSEWTYPSIATISTGLKASHHMMVHPNISISLPKDTKTLSEYFNEAGYYTAKIDGDWRSTPEYGYSRGIDRIIYQHQSNGSKYYDVIQDTIEHLEMSSETNQYVWVCIGDLHDISDEFDLPPSIQAKSSIDDIEGMSGRTTSLKQQYNEHKINLFKLYAKRIDLAMSNLYRYIEQNYKDNEIVVSLFSDHGQGFMIKENEHFFAPARSNTALMIRSSYKQGTICNEYISTTDYIEIMGKLSNIPIVSTIDSNLPQYLGGLKEREYVFSQCLHAGDYYKAAFHTKEHACYIQTGDTIDYDGRFNLKEYTITIIDNNNIIINDESLNNYYLNELKSHISHLQHY